MIVLSQDKDELALTLCGKKRKLKQEHFVQFGKKPELTDKQINRAFIRMVESKPEAVKRVDQSFLSNQKKADYKEVLKKKYNQLRLI